MSLDRLVSKWILNVIIYNLCKFYASHANNTTLRNQNLTFTYNSTYQYKVGLVLRSFGNMKLTFLIDIPDGCGHESNANAMCVEIESIFKRCTRTFGFKSSTLIADFRRFITQDKYVFYRLFCANRLSTIAPSVARSLRVCLKPFWQFLGISCTLSIASN